MDLDPAYVVTKSERQMLHGHSSLAKDLYHILRAAMDYDSRVVGASRRVSYQMLIEETEWAVPKGGGFDRKRWHRHEIRRGLEELIRTGLIRRMGDDGGLVFRLPYAYCRGSSKTNLPRISHEPLTGEASAGAACRGESPTNLPHTSHTSEVYQRTTLSEVSKDTSSSSAGDDGARRLLGAQREARRLQTVEAEEVLAYLSASSGRSYLFRNPKGEMTANGRMVMDRLGEGYTALQLRLVVSAKSEQWRGDAKMDQFIRPSTLFQKTKFATYLAEAEA